MNEYDVKRLALVLAIQAEIEGMKAENAYMEAIGHEPTHNEDSFREQAEKLRDVAYYHNQQL
jgi:hypothetical protein